jgi:hypothetical protein
MAIFMESPAFRSGAGLVSHALLADFHAASEALILPTQVEPNHPAVLAACRTYPQTLSQPSGHQYCDLN